MFLTIATLCWFYGFIRVVYRGLAPRWSPSSSSALAASEAAPPAYLNQTRPCAEEPHHRAQHLLRHLAAFFFPNSSGIIKLQLNRSDDRPNAMSVLMNVISWDPHTEGSSITSSHNNNNNNNNSNNSRRAALKLNHIRCFSLHLRDFCASIVVFIALLYDYYVK